MKIGRHQHNSCQASASRRTHRPSCGGVTPHSSSSSSTSPASFTAPALPAASAAAKPACRKLLAGNHLQESCAASYAAVHGRGQVGRSAAGSARRADPGRSCLLRPGIQKAAKPLPAVGRAVLDPSSAQGLTGGKGNRSSHIPGSGTGQMRKGRAGMAAGPISCSASNAFCMLHAAFSCCSQHSRAGYVGRLLWHAAVGWSNMRVTFVTCASPGSRDTEHTAQQCSRT